MQHAALERAALMYRQMLIIARYIAGAVRTPVIADADTGFGDAIVVVRTAREYIGAGIGGIHLEDQESPKRCGNVAGKTALQVDEAVGSSARPM